MAEPSITFATNELAYQHEEIPAHLSDQLESHYDSLISAVSMRKAPFPAHRNRGVSITVEDEKTSVVVHAARTKGVVEILGINIRVRDERQQEDYLATKEVPCPLCLAEPGVPCREPDGHRVTYVWTEKSHRRATHLSRRELQQTGINPRTGEPNLRAVPLTAVGIRNEMADGSHPGWAKTFDSYRHMYDDAAMAEGLIDGAMRVVAKHFPDRLWAPSKFLSLMCEQVSGPHEDKLRLVAKAVGSAHRLGRIDNRQFAHYQRIGMMAYADFAGLDFAPHPLGGFVAVRGLKDL